MTPHTTRDGRWPDFLIVGAAKAGTTSLFYYLRQHPGIFMPKSKEPWFFAFADTGVPDDPFLKRVPLVTDQKEYLELFAGASPSQLTGEASTVYLYDFENSIRSILQRHPAPREVRIIILLREPAARAHSHATYDVREGFPPQDLETLVSRWPDSHVPRYSNYVAYGMYAEQVRAYRKAFPHVLVLTQERLQSHTAEVVDETIRFLGLPQAKIDTTLRANESGVPRSRAALDFVTRPNAIKNLVKPLLPEMVRARLRATAMRLLMRKPKQPPVIRRLRELYAEDRARLEAELGRAFPEWK